MIPIPEGKFQMGSESGSSDEQPPHPVTINNPFYLGTTEVTFAQYDAFCEATGRAKPPDSGWPDRQTRPAINVDWKDAKDYTGWLDAMTRNACRLPSEAEWEYAARAGTTAEYALPAPHGSDDIAGEGLANCDGCGSEWDNRQTAPVRSFEPNAWGLYDMHGNVSEWVDDCWHNTYAQAPRDFWTPATVNARSRRRWHPGGPG
jgi:formylglycine-generating enzyme required for sulfatase activity